MSKRIRSSNSKSTLLLIVEEGNKIRRLQSVSHKNLSFCHMINIFLMLFSILYLVYFSLHLVEKNYFILQLQRHEQKSRRKKLKKKL